MLGRIGLLYRTVKDLQPVQVSSRIFLASKAKVRQFVRPRVRDYNVRISTLRPITLELQWLARPGYIKRADDCISGRFSFLNRTVQFPGKIDWNSSREPRLWSFNLNYCGVVLDLACAYRKTGDDRYLQGLSEHILSWICANRILTGNPWTPYTASVRAVNWILACSQVWDELEPRFVHALASSLLNHLNFIRANLEFDVGCNHLFENIKALIIGGIFLGPNEAGKPFLQQGQRLLMEQIENQILQDGGHCERSPMYHAIVLEDLLIIRHAYSATGLERPVLLDSCISRMAAFLRGLVLPNGELPLFNDSVRDLARPPSELLRWAYEVVGGEDPCSERLLIFPSTGYVRCRNAIGDVLVFRFGPPGPVYQPGHAHADTLSFVLCKADGTEVLIDPGVSDYEPGRWRGYFRSTLAHNTVRVDAMDSTEVWGVFRAGRKANTLAYGCKELGSAVHVFGEHDGYSRLAGQPVHRRDVYFFDDGSLVVLDTLNGRGVHDVEVLLHYSPDCSVSIDSADIIVVNAGNHRMCLRFLVKGRLSVHRGQLEPILGWYAPRFGQKIPSPTVKWFKRVELPFRCGFVLQPCSSGLAFNFTGDMITLPLHLGSLPRTIVLGPI